MALTLIRIQKTISKRPFLQFIMVIPSTFSLSLAKAKKEKHKPTLYFRGTW